MAMTIVEAAPGVTGGVDTHSDSHVAAALDPLGRLVGTESFDANVGGYKALLTWLEGFGDVTTIGVEGTGSYGAGLARFLRRRGVKVVEVNRPNRQSRRNEGKSDTLDAIEAARAALSGRASGAGKTKDGPIEAIRVLVVAKRSARQARGKAIVQMRHLGFTAPEQLHCRLKGLSVTGLIAESAKLRPTQSSDPVTAATKASLSSLAHRIQSLDAELAMLDEKIGSLLAATAPELLARFGVGPDTAAALLLAALMLMAGVALAAIGLDSCGESCSCPADIVSVCPRTTSGPMPCYYIRTDRPVKGRRTVRYEGHTVPVVGWLPKGCSTDGSSTYLSNVGRYQVWQTQAHGTIHVQAVYGNPTFGSPVPIPTSNAAPGGCC